MNGPSPIAHEGDGGRAPVKIGFVLLSNSRNPIPSTRIAILNMFPFLRAAHFDPHIAFEPDQGNARPDLDGLAPKLAAQGFQIIVFQKVHGHSVEALARALGQLGVRTVFCVCDIVDNAMAAATDATVVVTDFLKSLYAPDLRHKIRVVHDGIENPALHKQDWGSHRGSTSQPLRAVLVTSAHLDRLPQIGTPPSWLEVTIVGRYSPEQQRLQRLRQARWTLLQQPGNAERIAYLKFMLDRRIRCVAWDAEGVYQRMLQADIGIIPVDDTQTGNESATVPDWKVKSENRMSMKMCLGLPVIATPIPAYEPIVRQGENGFLARSRAQWLDYLECLRDPAERARIGAAARASVLQAYSMQEQARLLMVLFDELMDARTVAQPV